MMFMRDRRRYGINRVKILVSIGMQLQKYDYVKLIKSLQILNCLGASSTVQE